MDDETELMVQWFELINKKNELVRKEADLMYRQRQQQLEAEHEDLEHELRCLMARPSEWGGGGEWLVWTSWGLWQDKISLPNPL